MEPNRRIVSALLLLLLLALAAPAAATTMVQLDLSELTWIADLVIEAEVVSDQVERMPGQEYLQTATRVRVTRVIKGELEESALVDVVEPGGRLAGEETHLPSAPTFAPQERVLLFLEERDGELSCIGLSQGKLTLIAEQDTGRDVVVKVSPPRGAARFDEAAVTLPARRLYADEIVERVRQDLEMGFVPEYRRIPGLPAAKDARFRSEAAAAGKLDPRWNGGER